MRRNNDKNRKQSIDTQVLQMEDLMPLIRGQLESGQTVSFTPTGISMQPMLRHNRDTVVLAPLPDRLSKYDVALYRRENGSYVLHRVVDVVEATDAAAGVAYTFLGDNQFAAEPGLRHDQMIGVVREFTRGGRKHSVDEAGYKLYCRLWYHSRRFRHLWRRFRRKLGCLLGR